MPSSPSDPSDPGAQRAPRTVVRASVRRRSARPWADIVVPVLLVVLLAGFGMILYTGKARGGLTRNPTRAEARCALCRSNLESLVPVWRARGEFPPVLHHAVYGGMDGLACANDDGAAYVLRDVARFPVDPSRAAEEPLAACLGLRSRAGPWLPPHGETVLVAFADATVKDLDWKAMGLPEAPPEGSPPPVVGPGSPSPILRVMRLAR